MKAMKYRIIRSIGSISLVFAGSLSAWTVLPASKEMQEPASTDSPAGASDVSLAILNNSRLRAYYYREYLERYYYNRNHVRMDRNFIEHWIDQQIIYNAQVIAGKLRLFNDNYEVATQLLDRIDREPGRAEIKRQARRFFGDFRNDVGDLRARIDFIVSGLDSKPEGDNRHYATEKGSARQRMELLKGELDKADRQIRDYFLKPTHTVKVRDLEENNMMIRLYRIEKILESLEKTDL